MPSVVVLAPPAKGVRCLLDPRREILVGRDGTCELVLAKRSISRKHARLFFDGECFCIEDLQSANGTFVNGKRITTATPLKDGDRINLYDVPLVFHLSETVGDDPLAALESPLPPMTGGIDLAPVIPPVAEDSSPDLKLMRGRLQHLMEITRRFGSFLAVDQILPRVLDILFEMFPQATLGEIQLVDAEGRLNPVALKHGRDDDSGLLTHMPVGNNLSQQVLKSGEPLLKFDDDANGESVLDEVSSTLMCVPVLGQSRTALGTILLEGNDAAGSFTEDDLEMVSVVGVLAGQALEYARAHEQLLKFDQTRRQLDLSRQIQLRMLPHAQPVVSGLTFAAHYAPADAVGGDFYFFDQLPEDRIVVGVADASGKSLSAALKVAQFAAEVRHCIATAPTVKTALASLNRYVVEMDEGFITFCLCLIDMPRHFLTVVNAGHLPPLRRRANGEVEELGWERRGLPLGISIAEIFHPTTVELKVGDEVLLYTDGVTEAMSPQQGLFGRPRLRQIVESTPRTGIAELIAAVVAEVEKFRGGLPPSDDCCLLGFSRDRV